MFYLLKSDFERDKVGDILVLPEQIEAIAFMKKKFRDTENFLYKIVVHMKSNDSWTGVYKSEASAKEAIKGMLGDKLSDADLQDLVPQESN